MNSFDTSSFVDYTLRLQQTLSQTDWPVIGRLATAMQRCWREGKRVYLCGNGGSAANAMHAANDLFYGIGKGTGPGLRAYALPANVSVFSCLANDEGYDHVFSQQLAVEGQVGDIIIVFSGSGNSPNILKVLEQAKAMDIESYAILGFTGGKAKDMADVPIHFAVNDMQISEDLQMILIHMLMQWLYRTGKAETMHP